MRRCNANQLSPKGCAARRSRSDQVTAEPADRIVTRRGRAIWCLHATRNPPVRLAGTRRARTRLALYVRSVFKKPVDKLAQAAAQARDAGDKLFVPKVHLVGDTTGALLTAIEAQGWKLEHWAVGSSGGPSPVIGYPVFRRV